MSSSYGTTMDAYSVKYGWRLTGDQSKPADAIRDVKLYLLKFMAAPAKSLIVTVGFLGPDEFAGNSSLGSKWESSDASSANFTCYAKLSDFEPIYDIIRSEKPLWFWWTENGSKIKAFAIGTRHEPFGEGPQDVSDWLTHPKSQP